MTEKTKAKTKVKKEPEKKAEKKKAIPHWSSRIGYPQSWHAGVKKLAEQKDCQIKQIYQMALRDFLLKHNLLPPNNKS